MKIYNKLVRDNILDIIRKDGEKPISRKLSIKEFKIEALRKVVEEAKEVFSASDSKENLIKEIADMEEILLAVMKAYNISCAQVSKVRNKRKKDRGGFSKRIFLKKTI